MECFLFSSLSIRSGFFLLSLLLESQLLWHGLARRPPACSIICTARQACQALYMIKCLCEFFIRFRGLVINSFCFAACQSRKTSYLSPAGLDEGEQQQPVSPRELTGLLKACLSNQQLLFIYVIFLELYFIYPLCRTVMIEASSFPCNLRGKNRHRAPFVWTVRVHVAQIVAPRSLQSNIEVFSVNTHANRLLWPHPVSVFNRTNVAAKGKKNPLLAGLFRIRAGVLSPIQGSFAIKPSRLHRF